MTFTEPQFGDPPTPGSPPLPQAERAPEYIVAKQANTSQPEDRHVVTHQLARDLPMLLDGDFLQVENHDAKTIVFRWDGKFYPVEPGGTSFVPFEALVNQLGDPRSQDNAVTKFSDGQGRKGVVMDRHFELSRLFAMYAVPNERIDVDGFDKDGNPEICLVNKVPKVVVKTVHGQAVFFPCQRPDMLPYPVQNIDPYAVNTDTTRMVDQVAAENQDLRAQLERLEARLDAEMARREGVEAAT